MTAEVDQHRHGPRRDWDIFDLKGHGTSARTEILAGATTFLTMSYIMFVNPTILADAGMPKGAVFVATCLIAAIGSTIMGLAANYPIAMAPGMGLNAYFAYTMVGQLNFSWQAALGAVFISGCCFLSSRSSASATGSSRAFRRACGSVLRSGSVSFSA